MHASMHSDVERLVAPYEKGLRMFYEVVVGSRAPEERPHEAGG
jgi:hypothetical protein